MIEMLVQIVAWSLLPALNIGPVRVDLEPPVIDLEVRLFPENALLKFTHDYRLLGWIAFAVHLHVPIIKLTIDEAGLVVSSLVF